MTMNRNAPQHQAFRCVACRAAVIIAALLGVAGAEQQTVGTTPSYVVLTDLASDDPFFPAARKLQQHRSARLVHFQTGRITDSLGSLREAQPEFVAIVLRPDSFDINLAYDVLELATKVDDDPFVDFAFGFITGTTADDTMALVERTIDAESAPPLGEHRVFAFGPVSTPQVVEGNAFPWLEGWNCQRIEHKPGHFPPALKQDLAAADVIRFWGHGAPDSVDDGLVRADLDDLALRARMVFAGPCFSAVTHRYYDTPGKSKTLEERTVAADRSLALAFLSKGALTYYGAMQEDRCISAGQEFEHAMTHGGPAGMTMKHTHDRIVMAHSGDAPLAFSRLEGGIPDPDEKGTAGLLRLAAARVLLGDPAFRPLADSAKPPLVTTLEPSVSGYQITATIANPEIRSTFVNPLREDMCKCCDDNDTLYLQVPMPAAATPVLRIEVVALPACLESVKHGSVEWREESWLGQRILHVQIDFRHDTLVGIKPETKVRFKVTTQSASPAAEPRQNDN